MFISYQIVFSYGNDIVKQSILCRNYTLKSNVETSFDILEKDWKS